MQNKIFLEGYEFELMEFVCAENKTFLVVRVSGKGGADSVLTKWVLEICPDNTKNKELNILSCEKRNIEGKWAPAKAQSTTYELMGDLGISGLLIDEEVGRETSDPDLEFRLVLDGETGPGNVRIAYITEEDVYRSAEKMHLITTGRIPLAPVKKSFCLYVVVPDGYKPLGACRVNISITKRGAFIVHEAGRFEVDDEKGQTVSRQIRTDILGSVKVIASIPLKSNQACGDVIEVCACDCFEVSETIGYSNEDKRFELKDIAVCPVRKSLDLTLLNAHCGRSVYRLDGEFTIECKRCV